jgi:hypothetical protein
MYSLPDSGNAKTIEIPENRINLEPVILPANKKLLIFRYEREEASPTNQPTKSHG